MNEEKVQYLEKALTNENNESIINRTFEEIEDEKSKILEELELSKNYTKELLKKLKEYRYVEELPDLQYGRYLRWINLKNPENITLATGGILCEIKIDKRISLVLKNNMHKFFQINIDDNLIFQRLSDQELIILYAICYVNKSTS